MAVIGHIADTGSGGLRPDLTNPNITDFCFLADPEAMLRRLMENSERKTSVEFRQILRPDHAIQQAEFYGKHLPEQKQKRFERLVLAGGRNLFIHRQMRSRPDANANAG